MDYGRTDGWKVRAVLEKPRGVFSFLRIRDGGREWVVGIGSGLIATALWAATPQLFGAVSPALQAVWEPIVTAVPWWVSLPTLFFAVFGLVNMIQKLTAARATSAREAIEPASPALLNVDIRRNGGVLLTRGAMARQFWVYLKLTNFAPYPLRVRHISIDVWFGQPTLKLILDQPFVMAPRSIKDDIGLSDILDAEMISKIEAYLSSNYLGKELTLNVSVVCESDGGPVDKAEGIHVRDPELSLVAR